MDPKAQVVQLKTQLVSEGHTRFMLAETDLMTLKFTVTPRASVKMRCTRIPKKIISS